MATKTRRTEISLVSSVEDLEWIVRLNMAEQSSATVAAEASEVHPMGYEGNTSEVISSMARNWLLQKQQGKKKRQSYRELSLKKNRAWIRSRQQPSYRR